MIDFGLYLMYFLTIVAAAAACVFPLMYMVKNFQEAKKPLMALGGMLVLFLFSWGIASGEVMPAWEKFSISSSEAKLIGGGLICTYLMIAISIVVLVYAEVKDLMK